MTCDMTFTKNCQIMQSPLFNQQPPTFATKEQFEALQNRVIALETALSNILKQVPGNYNSGCGICNVCNSKEGEVICPVCKKSFCHYDWINHVFNGCQNS